MHMQGTPKTTVLHSSLLGKWTEVSKLSITRSFNLSALIRDMKLGTRSLTNEGPSFFALLVLPGLVVN